MKNIFRFLRHKVGDVPWMWVIIAVVMAIIFIGLGFVVAEKTISLGGRAIEIFVGE